MIDDKLRYYAAHVVNKDLCLPELARDVSIYLGITEAEYSKDRIGYYYKLVAKERFKFALAMVRAERELE